MKWTSEPPTEPGWYWTRRTGRGGMGTECIVETTGPHCRVWPHTKDRWGTPAGALEESREWAGPIPEPEEDDS